MIWTDHHSSIELNHNLVNTCQWTLAKDNRGNMSKYKNLKEAALLDNFNNQKEADFHKQIKLDLWIKNRKIG